MRFTVKVRRHQPNRCAMRRLSALGPFIALIVLAPGASAADSGGASVPKTARQVRTGGGASYAPAPPRKPKPKPPGSGKPKPRQPPREGGRPTAPGPHFPIAGPFGFGGEGARFGTPRNGHTHQGQDLTAVQGTPVVAPVSGEVQSVQYQASGAGHYVVLDGAGEDRDYVFMHLRSGSIPVREGQQVSGGARIGEVGNTGRSFGAHLHFEIWVGGGWFSGGRPIDPLPLLRQWAPR